MARTTLGGDKEALHSVLRQRIRKVPCVQADVRALSKIEGVAVLRLLRFPQAWASQCSDLIRRRRRGATRLLLPLPRQT